MTRLVVVVMLTGAVAAWYLPAAVCDARVARVLGSRPPALVRTGRHLAAAVRRRLEDRRAPARRREQLVLGFVEGLVAELAAGAATPAAVVAAATRPDADPVLRAVSRHVELGGDPVLAIERAAARPGARGLWAVAACLQVSGRTGAGLADALGPVATALRDELDLAREVEGQLAAPRATARLLAALPVIVWVLGAGLGADPLHVVLTTPYGWGCLVLGIGLEVAGLRWVDAMARSVSAG